MIAQIVGKRSIADRTYRQGLCFGEKALPIGVLEVKDRVERPVEVVCEPGRLREQLVSRRPSHSPRPPSSISVISTSNWCEQFGQVTTPTESPLLLIRS